MSRGSASNVPKEEHLFSTPNGALLISQIAKSSEAIMVLETMLVAMAPLVTPSSAIALIMDSIAKVAT